jgi:hypothetical protein
MNFIPETVTSPLFPHNGSFFWFHGVVEDITDPLKVGRVKVRSIGYHTQNKKQLPTADLPWAVSLTPITSGSIKGVGISATGLKVGSWVLGFFRDGSSAQEPVILGSFQTSTDGVDDIPVAAKTNYPFRSVIRTESGHEIILDDKSGSEIIKIQHKSGSSITFQTNGNIDIAAVGEVNVTGTRIDLN